MLYLSTRNKTDSFTAYRAMHNDNTPDGGLYVPFRLTPFSDAERKEIRQMSFGNAVAKLLNLFFNEQLTGWDVDFCIGRTPVKLESAGHKTVVAELWHNTDGSYETTRNILYSRIFSTSQKPADWAKIAIDTAILFGIHTQMQEEMFDLSLPEDAVSQIAAAWYAKELGLPIGKIILTCSDMSPAWDFVLHGKLNTAALKQQSIGSDRLFERIFFDLYGYECVERYLNSRIFTLEEDAFRPIPEILSVVVVGNDRAENVTQNVVRTNGYKLSSDAATAYGGLQDYRSRGGESRPTLLLSLQKPVN